jgi:transcriptional regulator with XRE-family HTH domain
VDSVWVGFGQRIRELRCALGWTQREVAAQLGVCARAIIKYEQGRSGPIQVEPLRALRRLESVHAQELDGCDARS